MPAHMVYRTSLGLVEWCTYMCRGQHVNLGGGGGLHGYMMLLGSIVMQLCSCRVAVTVVLLCKISLD